ncbi:hypothetical protein SAURM35S_07324 [Streptomyces aurantiogriseus]
MADDVVHLARDPGTLGGGGEPAALVALDLQAPGAFLQRRQIHPADTECQADGGGGRRRPQQEEQAAQRIADIHQDADRHRHFGDRHRDGPAQHPQRTVPGQGVQGDERADAGLLPHAERPLDQGHQRDHEERDGRGPATPPQRHDECGGEEEQDAGRHLTAVDRFPEGTVAAVGEQVGQADQDDDQHHRGVEQPRMPAVQPLPVPLAAPQTAQERVRPGGVEPGGRRERRLPGGVRSGCRAFRAHGHHCPRAALRRRSGRAGRPPRRVSAPPSRRRPRAPHRARERPRTRAGRRWPTPRCWGSRG